MLSGANRVLPAPEDVKAFQQHRPTFLPAFLLRHYFWATRNGLRAHPVCPMVPFEGQGYTMPTCKAYFCVPETKSLQPVRENASGRTERAGETISYGETPLTVREGLARRFRTRKGSRPYGTAWRKDSVRENPSGRTGRAGETVPYGKTPLVVRNGLAERFRTGKRLWSYGMGWRDGSVRENASGRTERADGEVPYGKTPLAVRNGLARRFRTRKGSRPYGKGW